MKHLYILKISILLILILSISLFANNNDTIKYLNKLVANGYSDVAIDYSYKNMDKKEIKNFLLSMLLLKNKFNDIIKIVDAKSSDINQLKYLAKAYIFIGNSDKINSVLNIIKNKDRILYNDLFNLSKGIVFYKKYDYDDALKYLIKIKDKSDKLKNIIAKIYLYQGKVDSAENILKKTSKPDMFNYALLYYSVHNYKKSIKVLEGLDNHKDKEILLFNNYIKSGNLKKSEEILKRINVIETNNFYNNIKTLFSYNKFDEIENLLKNRKDSYLKFYYLGKINLNRKNFIYSITNFKKALHFNVNSEILFFLATAYENIEAYKAALPFYKKVVVMADNNEFYYDALYKLAYCYYKTGDFSEAVKYFNKYLNNEESNGKYLSEALRDLAVSYKKSGNFVEAIKIYTKLEELENNRNKKKAFNMVIADLWEKLDKYIYSAEILSKYIPIRDRKDIKILKKLGDIYYKLGDYKSSNIYYREYLDKADRNLPEIKLRIGLNYLYSDEIDNARKYLLSIIENETSDKSKEEALYWMGKIYFKNKNYKLSLVYFLRLYSLNKFSALIDQTKKYICYDSYILKDRETFVKFFKLLSNPAAFIKKFNLSLNEICKFVKCKDKIILSLNEQEQYNYFRSLYDSLKNKKNDYLLSVLKSNNYYGKDIIIYYYIGNIFFKKGIENKGVLAYNKFLNNSYNPLFYQEYKDAVVKLILYYFTQKNYQKVISFYPIYSNISELPQNIVFMIGYASYKYNLNKTSRKYLTKYITLANKGEKLFQAAFCLDKMNFLNDAEKGYLKSLKFLNNDKIIMEAYYWLGEIAVKNHKLSDALNYFLKIKLMYKYDDRWTPTASFQVAGIFEKMGKKEKAYVEYKYIYDKLTENDPRKKFVEKKIKELRIGNEQKK